MVTASLTMFCCVDDFNGHSLRERMNFLFQLKKNQTFVKEADHIY